MSTDLTPPPGAPGAPRDPAASGGGAVANDDRDNGPPAERGRAMRLIRRTLRPDSTPARIRAMTIAAITAIALLFATIAVIYTHARDGLQVIGHDAGPQVVATADLYFALSDMDAQVANVLLIGEESSLGLGQAESLDLYEQRRSEANNAMLQAAQLAGDDPTQQKTVQETLDGMGRYERLASEALQLSEQSEYQPGSPPAQVLKKYREATELMRLEVLPKAYNLTLDNASIVRTTYETERTWVLGGAAAIGLTGIIAILLLMRLHLYLAKAFRRRVNPAIAVAVAGTVLVTLGAAGVSYFEAQNMQRAKEEGFDSVLAVSRARAIGMGIHGDQSRFLLDPQRSDTYQQVYLDSSQSILFVDVDNLNAYYSKIDKGIADYEAGDVPPIGDDKRMLGFLGEQEKTPDIPGQPEALDEVMESYQTFQESDRSMRRLVAAGDDREAIALRMGANDGEVRGEFDRYDDSLEELYELHRGAFDSAIASGDRWIAGWAVGIPVAAVIIAGLVLAGVRPRLAEYR